MQKRYVVRLTDEERGRLEALLVRRGRAHARARKLLFYARILLKADASEGGPASSSWTDERIADALLETSAATVARERRRFCEDGLEVALMPRGSRAGRRLGGGYWTAGPRRISSPWPPARSRRRGGRAGR